jgi:glycosyltransferase involved in cell wall biosynthesis
VLADTLQLRRAIKWKNEGRIKTLLAGPNLVTRPTECNSLVASAEIDAYLVPSRWCLIAYEEDEPRLKNRIKLWPAGVDTNYWKPNGQDKTNEILVYLKYESRSFANQVDTRIRKHGYTPITIEYGKYKMENYRHLLNRVQAVVFLSRSESQGLALAEAWAMDVPTLVWNPQELIAHGKTYSEVSACPLLTPLTGVDWKMLDQLDIILSQFNHCKENFMPRQWVLNNLTDKKSAQIILDIIHSID